MSLTTNTIPNGVSSDGITIDPLSGDQQHYQVMSGGSLSNDIINGSHIFGGVVVQALSGGLVNNDTWIGATLQFDGGDLNGVTVSSGGSVGIDSTSANVGGVYVFSDGGFGNEGTLDGLTIYNGGTATNEGGTATQVVVSSGGTYVEDANGTGTVVNDHAAEIIYGTAISSTVMAGGNIYFDNGGQASAVTLGSGSFLGMTGGGHVSGVTADDATIHVGGAATAVDVTMTGGTLLVAPGNINAEVSDLTVGSGGQVIIDGYERRNFGGLIVGLVSGATLSSGATMTMAASASNAIAEASATVVDGGAAVGVGAFAVVAYGTISSGGVAVVSNNGMISGTTVSSGGTVVLLQGATDPELNALPGSIILSAGVVVLSDGIVVSAGGTLSNFTVASGVTDFLWSGGTAVSAMVSGGTEIVLSGGVASFTTLTSGYEYVSSGGVADFVTAGFEAGQIVSSDGVVSGTMLTSGGELEVDGGGSAGFTTVAPGADLSIFASGSATGTVLHGTEYVYSAAVANSTTIRGSGGEYVFAGSEPGYTVLTAGGGQFVYGALGGTPNIQIDSGGFQHVDYGGIATSTTVNSGGFEFVFSGGIASGTTLNSGGVIAVLPGGAVSGTNSQGGIVVSTGVLVTSAGVLVEVASAIFGAPIGPATTDYVLPAGTATSSTVAAGGAEYVYTGGVAIGAVVGSGGEESVRSGGTASDASIASGGYEYVHADANVVGTTVSGGGTAFLYSAGSATSVVVGSGGVEYVETGGSATLTTVEPGGSINLPELTFSGGQPTMSGDMLTVSEGTGVYQQLLAGDYLGLTFAATADANYTGAGTLVTLECFCAGTEILTTRGPMPVEALRPGDLLPTLAAEAPRPVVWIGRREVDCANHAEPDRVWPVRVAAGAFGPGRPYRDLFLSPDHAVFVHGVLIPVRLLVNGGSIAPVPRPWVSYFHVELPDHAVILAEGLPVESYLNIGDRGRFRVVGGGMFERAAAWPMSVARAWEARAAAPLIVSGPRLTAARELVRELAERWAMAGCDAAVRAVAAA